MDLEGLSYSRIDLARALKEIGVPTFVIARDGHFEWINNAGVELIGDRRGEPYLAVTATEDRGRARTNFARKVVGGMATAYDLTILSRGGVRLPVHVYSVPLREEERISGVFAVVTPRPDRRSLKRAQPREFDLTPRQAEVLALLATGLDTHQIARRLGISDETTRNHIRALLRQLDAHSRLEAVVFAIRLGLVDPHAG
jgi:DNA-binding CsgD family transcriptional regulator